MPLQGAITDFGADHAFGLVPKKSLEHYRIEISVSTTHNITEYYVQQMHEQREMATLPIIPGCQQQMSEVDGCMVPIITIDNDATDKHQQKNGISRTCVSR